MGLIHQAKALSSTHEHWADSVGVTATAFGDGNYQHWSHNSKAKGSCQVETLAEQGAMENTHILQSLRQAHSFPLCLHIFI